MTTHSHAYAEFSPDGASAAIMAGSHPHAVPVATVRPGPDGPVVELSGSAHTVPASALIEAVAMAAEVLNA